MMVAARRQQQHAPLRAAVTAQLAVAIGILAAAPVRLANLTAIRLGINLIKPGGPASNYWLVFPDYDVKNRVKLQHPLKPYLTHLIDEYVHDFRPALLRGRNEDWLFPGQRAGAKGKISFSGQITKAIYKATGLRITVHQFRHAAGAIILQRRPGEYELVRLLLGHRSVQTTINAYVGLESIQASEIFSQIVMEHLDDDPETRMMTRTNPLLAKSGGEHPRSLPVQEWPDADRRAWDDACRPGARFKPGGAASYLAQVSRDDFARRYGAFLGFLQRTGRLESEAAAAAQVTLSNVEAYITELAGRVRSVTVWNCIYKLRRAAELLAPTADFSWLAEIEKDLALVMEPRSKLDRLVFTGRLVEAGLTLVADAEKFASNDLARARGVRNGLMIALLALRPIRPKNFAALEIGHTFKLIHGTWWITLPRVSTKTRRPDERRVPAFLNRLDRRLSQPITTRPAWVPAAHQRPLDLLHHRPADDHEEHRVH